MTVWLAACAVAAAILVAAARGTPQQRLVDLSSPARAGPAARWAAASGPAGTALLMAVAAGTGVAAAGVPAGLAVVAAVTALVVARLRSSRRSSRLRDATRQATVEVTTGLAGELRAGRSPAQAIATVAPWSGPLQPTLASVAGMVAAGLPAADALRGAATVPGAEQLRQVAAAWRVSEATGGRLAGALDRLAASFDAEIELRQELDSALAGPRATVALLAGLPVMGLVLGQAVGAHPIRLLLYRPLGWGLLGAAALLDVAGVLIMSRITRWALRW